MAADTICMILEHVHICWICTLCTPCTAPQDGRLDLNGLWIDALSVDDISVDDLSIYDLSVDDLSIDELSVDDLDDLDDLHDIHYLNRGPLVRRGGIYNAIHRMVVKGIENLTNMSEHRQESCVGHESRSYYLFIFLNFYRFRSHTSRFFSLVMRGKVVIHYSLSSNGTIAIRTQPNMRFRFNLASSLIP